MSEWTCSKCGGYLSTAGVCHNCGTLGNVHGAYLYIEPNADAKIIMQQQEKIAELQAKIAELEEKLTIKTLENLKGESVLTDLESENKALRLIAGSHSMSELRRNKILAGDKWFKYPPAPEQNERSK